MESGHLMLSNTRFNYTFQVDLIKSIDVLITDYFDELLMFDRTFLLKHTPWMWIWLSNPINQFQFTFFGRIDHHQSDTL